MASYTAPSLNRVHIIATVSLKSTIPDFTGFEEVLPLFSFLAPLFQLTHTFAPSGTFDADTKVILYFCFIPLRDLNMAWRATLLKPGKYEDVTATEYQQCDFIQQKARLFWLTIHNW